MGIGDRAMLKELRITVGAIPFIAIIIILCY